MNRSTMGTYTKCSHCKIVKKRTSGTKCQFCKLIPKCEGCGIILGYYNRETEKLEYNELNHPSEINQNRCENCEFFEEKIKDHCFLCGEKLLFKSISTYLLRGNCCYSCEIKAIDKSNYTKKIRVVDKCINCGGLNPIEEDGTLCENCWKLKNNKKLD